MTMHGRGKQYSYLKISSLYSCVHGDNITWIKIKWGKAERVDLGFRNVEF